MGICQTCKHMKQGIMIYDPKLKDLKYVRHKDCEQFFSRYGFDKADCEEWEEN